MAWWDDYKLDAGGTLFGASDTFTRGTKMVMAVDISLVAVVILVRHLLATQRRLLLLVWRCPQHSLLLSRPLRIVLVTTLQMLMFFRLGLPVQWNRSEWLLGNGYRSW